MIRAPRVVVLLEVVILAAAAYELGDALGWIPLGNEPGAGPAGEGAIVLAAFVAMLLGGIGAIAAAVRGQRRQSWHWIPLPLAAAALVGARFFTYDPYYLPTLRRISDGGTTTGAWIVGLVAFCALASLLTALRRRVGLPLAGLVVLVCALTTAFEGTGH